MKKLSSANDEQCDVHIQMLGGFSVCVAGKTIPDGQWKSRRARSLVKLLALAPGHRLHRDQVIDALWPDSDLPAAANSFYQTLYAARKILEPGRGFSLALQEGSLSLSTRDGQAFSVDVEQFEAAAVRAKDSQSPAVFQEALDWYRGNLLPEDLYEEWTIQKREALRQIYLNLRLGLARLQETRQEYPAAIATLLRLLEEDRAHEPAHVGLMRLYALSGQRQQALRQFQTLREALQAELDVEPGKHATQVYEAIQNGSFSPAQPTIAVHLHNLPVQLTSFIGREAQILEVTRIDSKAHRLVTLHGSGGTGKTRLALEVAALWSTRPGPGWSSWPRSPTRRGAPNCRRGAGLAAPQRDQLPGSWSATCATSGCCWCWTTASTCWKPAPWWPIFCGCPG